MQIQQTIVKIQGKGLITIPKSYRDELGLEKDSLARVTKIKGKLILEPVKTLPYSVRSYTDSEIKKFLNLDKRQSSELKAKGLI
jgi:AbrB family looped-hinge helix DNA binding protein